MLAEYEVLRFGNEQEPIVLIEDFTTQFTPIFEAARSATFTADNPHYPGQCAPADPAYLGENMDVLTQILKDIFGLKGGASIAQCQYSLVTTKPQNLQPAQCLPHSEGLDTGRISVLHYMSGETQGGTAFYRHIATGFETVTAPRSEIYNRKLEQEVKLLGPLPKAYMFGSNVQFEQIGQIGATRDRAIIYRNTVLRAPQIPENFSFSENIDEGRLTIQTIFQPN